MPLAKYPVTASLASATRRFAPLATVAYVVIAAAELQPERGTQALWLGLVAMGVGVWAMKMKSGLGRAIGWGLAMAVASLGCPTGVSPLLDGCGAVGVLVSTIGCCLAIARVRTGERFGSFGAVPVGWRSIGPTIAALLIPWSVAVAATVASGRGKPALWASHPRAWTWVAMLATAVVLVATIERTLSRRHFELGIAERMRSARVVLWIELAGSSLIALFVRGNPDGVVRLSLAVAGCAAAATALYPDAIAVARVARRVVGLALVGGGIALLGASAVEGEAAGAWIVTLVTALACLCSSRASSRVEASLRPSGGAWLDAFDVACEKALHADPREAVRGALSALRAPLGLAGPSPELWTFGPSRVTSVDAAGYAHEREAELPPTLISIALAEPYAALRAEALEALEVRRPEVRPLCTWMRDRGALLAITVACDGEIEGALVLPRGPRRELVTLEEIVAARRVADRIAMATRAHATELRLLAHAQASIRSAEAAEDRAQRLEHDRALEQHRSVLATERLARPATVGIYAAASRMALEALERRTRVGAPIAVVAAGGVDPIPYLARAHLAGMRAKGPFVLVDATSAREHDLARWVDPQRSPLALADCGILVLLDVGALPLEVQRLVARACAEARTPWERPDRLDVQLAITSLSEPSDLAAAGRLDSALEVRLGEAASTPVVLPRLQERPDDFRAVLTDRLAREGLRARGRPVGIEPAAYVRLAEYPFPGDDAELAVAVRRLVAECKTDTVRVADLEALDVPRFGSSRRKDPLSA